MQLKTNIVFLVLLTTMVKCKEGVEEYQAEDNEKTGPKKSREKRSVILLPAGTSITITFDLSMPVAALAAQLGFYNMRVPFRFFIPTYNQITSYYGRTDEDQDNEIERQFHQQEQERANEERRFIYKNIESLLSRHIPSTHLKPYLT